MIKINIKVLRIIVLAFIGLLNGIWIPILFDGLSNDQIAFIQSEYMISILLSGINLALMFKLIYRMRSIKHMKNHIFLMDFKHGKEPVYILELCSLLSILSLFLAWKMKGVVFIVLMVFFILICVNSILTLKVKNGMDESYITLNGKQYLISQIESFDIGIDYAQFKMTSKFLFMIITEDIRVVILERDAETLKQHLRMLT